jgi:hypothetical protein
MVTICPSGVSNSLPYMALIELNNMFVTPTVKVSIIGSGVFSVSVTAAATLAGADGTTTTVKLLYSNKGFKNATLSADTFFSTMAHLILSRSYEILLELIAIINFNSMIYKMLNE